MIGLPGLEQRIVKRYHGHPTNYFAGTDVEWHELSASWRPIRRAAPPRF